MPAPTLSCPIGVSASVRETLEVLEAADAPEAFGGTTQASLRARIADLQAR